MQKIIIVDYGMGNLHSVKKALIKMSKNSDFIEVSSEAKAISLADKIVFPGVGASGAAMRKIEEAQILMALKQALQEKQFLGICLGMQVLFETSEEDLSIKNIGHFAGEIKKFDYEKLNANLKENAKQSDAINSNGAQKAKVPHMGWNSAQVEGEAHKLWNLTAKEFYFVHSYYLPYESSKNFDSVLVTEYAGQKFISGIVKDNIVATQFHPEKSSSAGLEFFENFLTW